MFVLKRGICVYLINSSVLFDSSVTLKRLP